MIDVELMESIMEQNFIEQAKAMARSHGHKNIDELIVLKGDRKLPVWQFYMNEVRNRHSR